MATSPSIPFITDPSDEQPLSSTENSNSGQPSTTTTIQRVCASENSAITRTEDRLNEENWMVWRHRLTLMLQICGVQDYVTGGVHRPDIDQDPNGAANWDFNDTYARVLIANNVTTTQMVHISQCRTAHECWTSLEAIHDAKSHQTTIGIIRNLYRASAEDGDNIAKQLNKLSRYWERINLIADDDFKVLDNQFKVLISSSLPAEWDTFTEAYVGRRKDIPETDPKKLMSSQQFIGIIKEEAIRRNTCRAESSHNVILASNPTTGKAKYCVICKRNNHNTTEYRNSDKKPCEICKKTRTRGQRLLVW
jgi:gag-polypeptide of LTR copia-type